MGSLDTTKLVGTGTGVPPTVGDLEHERAVCPACKVDTGWTPLRWYT